MPELPDVVDALTALATPKSVTMAEPPDMSTLSGLMSRCTTPASCAKASALATSRSTRIASITGSSPRWASWARSDSPFTYGIVKNGRPSDAPAVRSGTMCGCWSCAASEISRLNRSTETCPAMSDGNTFTTTFRPSARSVATKTRDMPPPPSSRSRVYASPSVRWSCS